MITMDCDYLRRKWRRFWRYCRKPLLAFIAVEFLIFLFTLRQLLVEVYINGIDVNFTSEFKNFSLLVNTSGCLIIELDAFSQAVKPFLRTKTKPNCKPPVVIAVDGMLKYSENHTNLKHATCCYNEIHWKHQKPDLDDLGERAVRYSRPCRIIPPDGVEFPSEFVRVTCEFEKKLKIKTEQFFYAKAFPPDHHSNETSSKAARVKQRWKIELAKGAVTQDVYPPPSVLIVHISGVSRNNFIRSLPETRKFLLENDFIELKGYTAVSEDLFSSMIALLAGVEENENNRSIRLCFAPKGHLDMCPFIWKNFSDRGYVTGFMEDAPGAPTFQDYSSGFFLPPVDYYGRPFTAAYLASDSFEGTHGKPQCVGGYPETELLLNYTIDFVNTTREIPSFFLASHVSVARTDFNNLKPWDSDFKGFWQKVRELTKGQLHEPVMIFLSEQGAHYGFFRTTPQGYYESKLPYAFIRMPPSLKNQRPDWYQNLKQNAKRLTTAFDLHATLQDILNLAADTNEFQTSTAEFLNFTTYSLFNKIPSTRTCENAGIIEDDCLCGVEVDELNNAESLLANELTEFTNDRMNEILQHEIKRNVCLPMEVDELLYMRGFHEVVNKSTGELLHKDYIVGISVKHAGTTYEIHFRVYGDGRIDMGKEISPTSVPKGHGDCVPQHKYKHLCICRDRFEKLRAQNTTEGAGDATE